MAQLFLWAERIMKITTPFIRCISNAMAWLMQQYCEIIQISIDKRTHFVDNSNFFWYHYIILLESSL